MSDLREKCELLSVRGTQIDPPNAEVTQKSLYEDLTILDTKASALMTFDGILIAAASFTVGKQSIFGRLSLIVIIMALAAAGFCLLVAQVSYPFLGKVVLTRGTPERPARLDYSEELEALDDAVTCRTWFYRIAWWLSLGAVLISFGMSLKSYVCGS